METQDALYLKQFYCHPALAGKINPYLKMASFRDQVIYQVQAGLDRRPNDFVLRHGYDVLHRLAPHHFPPLEKIIKEMR